MEKKKHIWALVLSIVMFISAWVSLIAKFVSMGKTEEDFYMVASRVNIGQTKCDTCGAAYVNGFCDCEGDAEYQEPVLVTSENREALGLGEEYLGYSAISNAGELFWFLYNAYENTNIWQENYGYGDTEHLPPANMAVLLNDIYVNSSKEKTDVSMCAGVKKSFWRDLAEVGVSSIISKLMFDGRGYVISGIYQSERVGIFANVVNYNNYGGPKQNEIKDLGIVNSYFAGGGSLSSHMYGTVIRNCYNEGTVEGPDGVMGVGGFIGYGGELDIENCYNAGFINSSSYYVGGFIGGLEGNSIIKNCYNTGNVVSINTSTGAYAGGLVGFVIQYLNSEVHNCYNYGSVSSSSPSAGLGGLFGIIRDVTNSRMYPFYANNCYYNSNAFSGSDIGNTEVAGPYFLSSCDSRTYDEFASGKVCYELNGNKTEGAFKQNIGEHISPNFTSSPVYKTKEYECDGTTFIKEYYSNLNDNYVHDHDYKFVETVDPNFETQTDGYDLYVCENNSEHERKVITSWTTLGANITFVENGGSEVQDMFLKKGTVVSDFTKPTRKGYEFAGWHYESYLQTKVGGTLTLEKDITLYAKWVKCDHANNENFRDCENGCVCSVCGEEMPPHGHSGVWTTTKEATALEEGEQRRTCSVCGKEQVESIPKVYSKAEPEVKVEEKRERSTSDIITIISTAIGAVGAGGVGLGTIVARIGKVFRKRKFGF